MLPERSDNRRSYPQAELLWRKWFQWSKRSRSVGWSALYRTESKASSNMAVDVGNLRLSSGYQMTTAGPGADGASQPSS